MPPNGRGKDKGSKLLRRCYDNRLHSICNVVISKDLRRIADRHLTLENNGKEKPLENDDWDPGWDEDEGGKSSNYANVSTFSNGEGSRTARKKIGPAKFTRKDFKDSNVVQTDSTSIVSPRSHLEMPRKSTGPVKTMKERLNSYKKNEIFKNWKAQNLQRCEKCEGEFEDLVSHAEECPSKDILQGTCFRTFDVTNKPEELKCQDCGKTFLKKIHLLLHQKIHATMDKKPTRSKPNLARKHLCTVCHLGFSTNVELLDHYSFNHAGNQNQVDSTAEFLEDAAYSCESCGQSFSFFSQLKGHERFCQVSRSIVVGNHSSVPTPLLESDFHETLFQYLSNSNEDEPSQLDNAQNNESISNIGNSVYSGRHRVTRVEDSKSNPKTEPISPQVLEQQNQSRSLEALSVKMKTKVKPKCVCKECGRRFPFPSMLKVHLKSHSKLAEIFSCSTCSKSFSSPSLLQFHLLVHKYSENQKKTEAHLRFKCQNSTCDCLFSDASDLSIHIKHSHFSKYSLCCEVCGKDFSSKDMLNNHRLTDHCLSQPTFYFLKGEIADDTVPDPYILFKKEDKMKADDAKEQPKTLVSPSGRRRGGHRIRTDIPFQDIYTCSTCDKTFDRRQFYLIHIAQHKREDQFRCHLCHKGFPSKDILTTHIKKHKDPNYNPNIRGRVRTDIPFQDVYTCKLCDREFDKRNLYIIHINIHEREEKHKCHLCPSKFLNDDLLQRHIKRHSDPNYVPGRRLRLDIPRQSMYTCETCGRKIKQRNVYISHISMHKREEKYTCSLCGKKNVTELMYLEHLERHKDPSYEPSKRGRFREDIPFQDEYSCEKCTKVFKDRHLFIIHLSVHKREEKYTCGECGRKFQSELPYLEHLNRHKDPDYDPTIRRRGRRREDIPIQDVYTCDKCQKVFKVRQLFMSHLSMHAREDKFVCSICEKKCLNKFLLEDHMKRHEDPNYVFTPRLRTGYRHVPVQGSYTCEICGRRFTKRATYNAHVFYHRRIQSGKFKCCKCDLPFISQAMLDQHLIKHEDPNYVPRRRRTVTSIPDQEEYSCGECDLKFTDKDKYRSHLLTHLPSTGRRGGKRRVDIPIQDIYNCKYCTKAFPDRTKYLIHLRYHELELKYKCPQCPKRFKIEAEVKSHLQTHSFDKPFECEDCLKRFKTKVVRDLHKQRYCKKIPCKYKCGRCPERFHNKNTLARHFERWHATNIQAPVEPAEIELSCRQCSQTFNTKEGLDRHVTLYHPTTTVTFKTEVDSAAAERENLETGDADNEEVADEIGHDWGDDDDEMPLISSFCETEITENQHHESASKDPSTHPRQRPLPGSCGCKFKKLKYQTQKYCHNMQCSCVRTKKRCGEDCDCGTNCMNSTDKERDQQESFRIGKESMMLEQGQDFSPNSFNPNSEQGHTFVPPPPPPVVVQPSLRIVQSEFISIDAEPTDESLKQLSFSGYVEGDDDPLDEPVDDPFAEPEEPAVAVTTAAVSESQSMPSTGLQSYLERALSLPILDKVSQQVIAPAPSRSSPAPSAATATVKFGAMTMQTPISTLEKAFDKNFSLNDNIMCQFCKKNFKVIPNFISHIFIHRQFDCKFNCSVCGNDFAGILDFIRHLDTHNKGLILQCSKCNSKFKSYTDLRKHLQVHHFRPMECGLCLTKFTNSQEMMTHWTKQHPTCQCGLCMVKFFSYDDLTFHMKSLHSTYDCTMCGTRFQKLEDLLGHVQARHGVTSTASASTSPQSYSTYNKKCNHCGLLFSNDTELNEHLANHLASRGAPEVSNSLQCGQCSKICKDVSELHEHIAQHVMSSSEPLINIPTQNPGTSSYSINDNTQAVEVLTCPRSDCLKNCGSRAVWVRHVRTHPSIIFCSSCFSIFNGADELKQHLRISTSCKVCLCQHCPCNFSHKKNLELHVLKCHASFKGEAGFQSSALPVITSSVSLAEQDDVEDSNIMIMRHQDIEEITLD